MKTSDLFVKALENEGVKYIFGIPGEENLDFLNSLKDSSIKFIITRHEQAAGFMASTLGRLTGKAGVCLSTLGPGATNLVTAAAYANLSGMPMLMITGQKPIKNSNQGHFQIINVVQMMQPVTKFNKQIVSGNSVPALVREVFRTAQKERPGAVHLELPEDIAKEDATAHLLPVNKTRRPIAEEKAIMSAIQMIEGAKHPLILVGAGGNRKLISRMLKYFIDKTGIPFFNTQLGKGVIDERHPLYLGTAALTDNDYVHSAVREADLIINIGHDVIEKPPFLMRENGPKVIHINFCSAKVDQVYFPQLEVLGDIANAIWQIAEKISVQPSWDFSHFLAVRKSFFEHLEKLARDNSFPMKPPRIVAEVRRALPDDGIVVLDNGMYKIWFTRNYPAYASNTLLVDNSLATMGAGLPSAIATKFLYPDKKVVAVAGDGGFMLNSQELETALRLNVDLVIVLLNDSGFGMIRWKQGKKGFAPFSLDFNNPDFIKYAESYGAKGYRVSSADDLGKILGECLNKKGVHLIEVPIDYSEDNKVLSECNLCH